MPNKFVVFRVGDRVSLGPDDDRHGTVVAAHDGYVRVRWDGMQLASGFGYVLETSPLCLVEPAETEKG